MKQTGLFIVVTAVAGLMLLPQEGLCLDKYFVGSRALGMAGANVASVNDNSAQYYNPAAFGFFGYGKDSGAGRLPVDNNNLASRNLRFGAEIGLGIRLHENLAKLLDDLSDIETADLGGDGVGNEEDLQNLVKLSSIISRLDEEGNAITIDSTTGFSFGMGHFAIGGYGYLQANARVPAGGVDFSNLGIALDGASLNDDLTGYGDGEFLALSEDQQSQLALAGFLGDAIESIDVAAREAGLTGADLQGAVDILALLIDADPAANNLEENQTTVELRGFGLVEIPVSYGWALNDNLAVGANIKAMRGRVYAQTIKIFESDTDSSDILDELKNDYSDTTTFGIDVGLLYRIQKIQMGLVARNVNAPKFKGPTVGGTRYDDMKVDPSLTAGVAFIPYEGLTLEVDYDLTKNETVYPGYETQYLALGAEWMVLRFLALRAGTYKNQAESDIGWVYTAGLGLRLLGVRLDIAGAMSAKKGEFDGKNFPLEGRGMAKLSFDF